MALLLSTIKQRLKSPEKKQIIKKAIRHENRLRFHVESFMEPSEISQPLTVFLDWVRTLIPKDKFNIFVNLFQFPSPTIKLTNTIFNELERVFDGKNPSASYQFTDSSHKDDWDSYRKEHLYKSPFWRNKGWQAMKTAINSILIVDIPKEQSSEFPDPYFYLLDISNVIDYSYKNDTIEWIIFKQEGNKIAVFDDTTYRIYEVDEDKELISEPEIEEPHELGYCPAKFFWTTELTQTYTDLKKSPLSQQLSNLDWLLFFSISKRHLDLYAPYPIYSAYEADCDFENNETGEFCDGGFLRNNRNEYMVHRDGSVASCPVCADKKLAGVGSFIEIPVPTGKDDPDLRNPISITTVDKSSLDYNVEEVSRLATEIMSSTIGFGGEAQQKQSMNEMQVSANFESRTSVLNSLKGNFEAAKKFVDDTVCKLRYGDHFISSSISMGTEFYIYSIDSLYTQLEQAKKNGASESELDDISSKILETEYRNNPTQFQRMSILKELEPYRHYTFEELMEMKDKSLLNDENLQIKINFSTFVDRFERENTNVVEFGHQLEFATKIKIITDEFKEYVRENNIQEPGNGDD